MFWRFAAVLLLLLSVGSAGIGQHVTADQDGAATVGHRAAVAQSYWLNTDSNVRHNSGCRYFGNTKYGRRCSASEGRACKICGG